MDSIISQIEALARNADAEGRKGILSALQDLQGRLEPPTEVFIKLYNSHIQVAVVYVAVQLGLFKGLAKDASATLTVAELAETCNASPDLLERILRYLSSVGFISNVGPGQFRANRTTFVLANPLADAGVIHAFDTCGPAIQAFPAFLADTKYQDITSNSNTPFQKGFHTDLTCFQWLPQQPRLFGAMQTVMTAFQSSDWVTGCSLLDSEAKLTAVGQLQHSEKPFFVDVGGGYGHQCVQLRDKYPNLHGRIVLEDLPAAVDELPPIDGVAVIAQDFFEKQTVEGAKFYYLRRIMHDWPDEQCISILQNIAAVMSSESRILIDESVLPDVNTNWHAAMADIMMGVLFAGKERTKEQWEKLVAKSGLRLADIHTYNVLEYNSIIVLEPQ
ncbi:hypothetical protein V493_08197 [Pseudogymnoascus sp. VKM F-4281 (FW-2241)]|nr:hypothetical protein V493_08197 [Pseudogymnoascus sp. VKM F-4281 (FW-2241)]